MFKITTAVLLGSLCVSAFGLHWTEPEIKTTHMLAAHTKYMEKRGIKAMDEPDDLLKAMRVCIVTQMAEPGCNELLYSKLFRIIVEE